MSSDPDAAHPMSTAGSETGEQVIAPGTSGSFEEPRHLEQRRPKGGGWRAVDGRPVVRAFIGEIWVDAPVIDVNDDTRELRVVWPPPHGQELTVHHMIVDAAHHQGAEGLFA